MKNFVTGIILIASIFCLTSFVNCRGAQILPEAKFYYNQGIDYYKSGQLDKSMEAFRSAIDTDANYIDAYYNLASILEYLKQDEEALSIFKKIIVRNPSDYDAAYRAANLSYKIGQLNQAQSYLSLIPKTSPVYQKALNLQNAIDNSLAKTNDVTDEEQLENKPSAEQSNFVYSDLESPTGITMDTTGNIYVASFSENIIYKITSDNKKVIYVKDEKISGPVGLATDLHDNLYVANYNKDNILKITPAGQISILLANIQKPYILYVKDNMLYISSQGANSVVRYKI